MLPSVRSRNRTSHAQNRQTRRRNSASKLCQRQPGISAGHGHLLGLSPLRAVSNPCQGTKKHTLTRANGGGGGNRTRMPGWALVLVGWCLGWSGHVSSRSRRCLSSPLEAGELRQTRVTVSKLCQVRARSKSVSWACRCVQVSARRALFSLACWRGVRPLAMCRSKGSSGAATGSRCSSDRGQKGLSVAVAYSSARIAAWALAAWASTVIRCPTTWMVGANPHVTLGLGYGAIRFDRFFGSSPIVQRVCRFFRHRCSVGSALVGCGCRICGLMCCQGSWSHWR